MNPKPVRILKIYNIKKSRYRKTVPWINLSGMWLNEAGFAIGQEIKVTIRKQLLVIEII
jgi:Toxin SymE, type I toxin-antitoxin system